MILVSKQNTKMAGRHPAALLSMVFLLSCLSACNSAPALPAELAAVECPTGRAAHAQVSFGGAKVNFVCLLPEFAANPELLRCESMREPKNCQNSGSFWLSRLPNKVITAALPMNEAGYVPSDDPSVDSGSLFKVEFDAQASSTANYDVQDQQFLYSGALPLPPGFRLLRGPVCDRVANPLNRGSCRFEAKTASLTWYIDVAIPRLQMEPMADSEYERELALWMKLLGKIAQDPAL